MLGGKSGGRVHKKNREDRRITGHLAL